MLTSLHIENVAVIEETGARFLPGLNVLTGETGAGKSIVIDAIGAVLGRRTSRELVRSGAEAAQVDAVFETGKKKTEISRRITADGRGSCRLDGQPIAVSRLRELGENLLDIHGQNDGRQLLDESSHLESLDHYAGLEEEKTAYRTAYRAWQETLRRVRELRLDEDEKQRRMEMLAFRISELEKAEIRPGEMRELEERRELLKNAVHIVDAIREADDALMDTDGAVDKLGEAESALRHAARWSEDLGKLAEALGELRFAAEDAAERLRDQRAEIDFPPGELERVEARLDRLKRLSRRYGPSEEEMLQSLETARLDLEAVESSDEDAERLERRAGQQRKEAEAMAAALSQKRRKAAEQLKTEVETQLRELSMPGVRFEVSFEEPEGGLDSNGCDEVAFLMSANAGEAPGRISRIASGGELSRIMLALKNILAAGDDVEAMVFDEIDTGVSGVAAQRVAESLGRLSRRKQVICVTHLPQIAAMADAQFVVRKSETGGRTYTMVERLDREGRVRELARLTGGENITRNTLLAAEEQISAAEAYKAALPAFQEKQPNDR